MATWFAMEANTGPEDSVDARVRARIRQLRTEQGLTLAQVAQRAHLDVSTLSRIETGKRRLALDHLPGLSAALGVSADELLGPVAPQDPRVTGEPIERDGLTLWPLSRRGPVTGLHAWKARIHAERDTPPDPLPVHDGHDWMYVLSGQMRLILGTEDLVVEPGETVEFFTRTPHWFGTVKGPVELIALFGQHGEREHVHP
jgi:transcriptional regulator with XRE-family HTH domain